MFSQPSTHNPKVGGSNPPPATSLKLHAISHLNQILRAANELQLVPISSCSVTTGSSTPSALSAGQNTYCATRRLHPPRAISNSRLVALSEGNVTFRWRDSAHHNKKRLMTCRSKSSCADSSCTCCRAVLCASATSDFLLTGSEQNAFHSVLGRSSNPIRQQRAPPHRYRLRTSNCTGRATEAISGS
jgi:hypothetical protein